MWAHDGSNWVDTGTPGQPAPGQLSVASESGLPNSIIVSVAGASAGASPGGRLRFFMPRVSFQDSYIAQRTAPAGTQRNASFVNVGWGTLAVTPNATNQSLGGSIPFDGFDLPAFSVFTTPPQFDGLQMPWGWVLVARSVEPLLDSRDASNPCPLFLVTDTYTYFQKREFM